MRVPPKETSTEPAAERGEVALEGDRSQFVGLAAIGAWGLLGQVAGRPSSQTTAGPAQPAPHILSRFPGSSQDPGATMVP